MVFGYVLIGGIVFMLGVFDFVYDILYENVCVVIFDYIGVCEF